MSFLLDRSPSTLGGSRSTIVFTKLLALVATLPMLFPAWFCACFKHESNCCTHVQEVPGRCCHRHVTTSPAGNEARGEPCQHKSEHAPTCPSTKPVSLLSQSAFCVDDSTPQGFVTLPVDMPAVIEPRGMAIDFSSHASSTSERPLYLTLRALLI